MSRNAVVDKEAKQRQQMLTSCPSKTKQGGLKVVRKEVSLKRNFSLFEQPVNSRYK